MNRLFVILAATLASFAFVPAADAAPNSAISVVGTATLAANPGSFPGCLGPTQVSSTWVHTCTAGTFTFTFDSVTLQGQAIVNGDGDFLVPGVAYTFSDFAGSLVISRTAGTTSYTIAINGAGTITSA